MIFNGRKVPDPLRFADRCSRRRVAVAAWLALASADVWAGAITVSPIRVELTPRRAVATLEVRNEGDEFVTVQIEKMDWTQPDGSDTYGASTALLATPTVFELPPHGSQTLRIGIRDPEASGSERAFRLYAAEVPSNDQADGDGLHMALRIGIPIFVEPASGSPRLVSELTQVADGKLALRVRNSGTRFTRTISVELQNAAGKTVWRDAHPTYLLAGGEHVWTFDSSSIAAPAAERLQLLVVTEDGHERIATSLAP